MKLTVVSTDRFRKTFRNLKKQEQELVDKGLDNWLRNPDNPSSNFEKLRFSADNIFSIRANSAWRIIMAKFDGVYFLLHTGGQHDKTNDWAKNKRIDRNAVTGAIQIYSQNVEDFEETHQVIASSKSSFFGAYTQEQLLAVGVPEKWLDTVQKLENDDQYMGLWEHLPDDALENLNLLLDDSVDIKILIAQLTEEAKQRPQSTEELVKVQPGFYVVGQDEQLIQVMNEDINLFRYYLHPSQKYYAYTDFKGPMKVTGSAGTGKTVVAMHRAKYLLEKLQPSDKPVFFTTFTKYLIKNIQSVFLSQNIRNEQLKVANLHSFALQYAQEIELLPTNLKLIGNKHEEDKVWKNFLRKHPEIPYSFDFLRDEYKMVLQKQHVTSWDAYKSVVREGRKDALPVAKREAVWEALKKYESYQQYTKQYTYDEVIFQLNKYIERWPEYKPFSHIICDEVQDFSNLELRLMRNLVEEKPNDLFLSGDPFQNIYQRKISFSKSGINIRGVRSHRLRVNYRTTEEIRQFAVQMLATHQYEDFSAGAASFKGDTSILHGEQPQYITFENETKASTFIIDFIKGSFGEIGLHELCLTARTMDQVEALQTQLQAAKIPAIKLADVSELSQVQHRVVLSTMHGLKGLEFKYLLVAGFDQSSFPYWPSGYKKWAAKDQQAYNKAEHALFYVVFSRAISKLIVTGIGAPVELGEWGD